MSRSSSQREYSNQMREEQKAILNGLLGIIYDNYDTTRRMQSTIDSIYRMIIFIVVVVVCLVIVVIGIGCYYGCRRRDSPMGSDTGPHHQSRPRFHYQSERGVQSPLHQPRKSAPIEL